MRHFGRLLQAVGSWSGSRVERPTPAAATTPVASQPSTPSGCEASTENSRFWATGCALGGSLSADSTWRTVQGTSSQTALSAAAPLEANTAAATVFSSCGESVPFVDPARAPVPAQAYGPVQPTIVTFSGLASMVPRDGVLPQLR